MFSDSRGEAPRSRMSTMSSSKHLYHLKTPAKWTRVSNPPLGSTCASGASRHFLGGSVPLQLVNLAHGKKGHVSKAGWPAFPRLPFQVILGC